MWVSRGTYAKSVTDANTSSRPESEKTSSSTVTVQAPFSGTTSHSLSPASNLCVPPGGSSTTRSALWVQPARSGSMSSAYGPRAVLPCGRCSPSALPVSVVVRLIEILAAVRPGGPLAPGCTQV
ncbi:hypothetical protein QFZ64_002570 [Streptomyces sp. B3I8]|nr:hypothetical protein [Streptomyces sp. B3I8]